MATEETFFSRRPLIVPGAAAALMLLGALGSWPYGYYTLLRWVTCAAAVIFAFHGYSTEKTWAAWAFGFVAILFNPFVPVHLTREIWQPIDVTAAILFTAGAAVLRSPGRETEGLK